MVKRLERSTEGLTLAAGVKEGSKAQRMNKKSHSGEVRAHSES